MSIIQKKLSQKKVQVWIYSQDPKTEIRFFLLLKTRPDRGAFWQPVTGGVEPGEDIRSAAMREAQEETQLQFEAAPVSLNHSFEFESRGRKVIEFGFLLRAKDFKSPVLMDPNEHTEYEWVEFNDALAKLKFSSNQEMLKTVQTLLKAE